jgi:hypothetical protein
VNPGEQIKIGKAAFVAYYGKRHKWSDQNSSVQLTWIGVGIAAVQQFQKLSPAPCQDHFGHQTGAESTISRE